MKFPITPKNLPKYTGCRYYSSEPRVESGKRPQGWFNSGGLFHGPNIQAVLDEQTESIIDTTTNSVSENVVSQGLSVTVTITASST